MFILTLNGSLSVESMGSKEELASDSLEVTEIPAALLDYVKSKVVDYASQTKDYTAQIHRVKGQPPKLVLSFGTKPASPRASSDLKSSPGHTNMILVQNLPPVVDEDLLEVFFESKKKYGGGPVKSVRILNKKNAAFVEFFKNSAVETVLGKTPIMFGKTELDVKPYKHFLVGTESIDYAEIKGLRMPKEFTDVLLESEIKRITPPPTYGPKLAAMIKDGTRVVRGKDWEWGNQDNGGAGTVVDAPENPKLENVLVQWDSGKSNYYRMGMYNRYDLMLAP